MGLYALSHVETLQGFSSLCLGSSGNVLCSKALIIHGAGYQGPYLHCHLSWCRLPLCPADALTLALKSTPFLQGERWMSHCSPFRFSSNDDPLASCIKRRMWQFIWQLPNFHANLKKNGSGELHDFREHLSCNTVQMKQVLQTYRTQYSSANWHTNSLASTSCLHQSTSYLCVSWVSRELVFCFAFFCP